MAGDVSPVAMFKFHIWLPLVSFFLILYLFIFFLWYCFFKIFKFSYILSFILAAIGQFLLQTKNCDGERSSENSSENYPNLGILAVELCFEQISSAKVRRRFVLVDYSISALISAAFLLAFLASTFQVEVNFDICCHYIIESTLFKDKYKSWNQRIFRFHALTLATPACSQKLGTIISLFDFIRVWRIQKNNMMMKQAGRIQSFAQGWIRILFSKVQT